MRDWVKDGTEVVDVRGWVDGGASDTEGDIFAG